MGQLLSELISAVGHSVRIAPGEGDSAIAPAVTIVVVLVQLRDACGSGRGAEGAFER